jgi:hypothetical protein
MLKILNFIIDFLRDRNDGSSYKRLLGVSCFVIAVIKTFTADPDVYIIAEYLAGAGVSAVATVFEKKNKEENAI